MSHATTDLQQTIEGLLLAKRGYVFEVPFSEAVIYLMTGGIDSSIGAELCLKKWNTEIYPLYILRGATAEKYEVEALKKVVGYLQGKYPDQVLDTCFINCKVPPVEIKKDLDHERVVKRGHPLRNSVMQNIAAQYGASLNDQGKKTRTILTASVASDYFPGSRMVDHRINTLYVCSNLEEWDWQISSPMFEGELIEGKKSLKKLDLIKWGIVNGFPFKITRTCTRAGSIACGICEECKERIKTFQGSGRQDPVKYKVKGEMVK